jgi:hypothetical protein
MSYTYTSFIAQLANFLVIPPGDPAFTQAIPAIIDDSEQKIYRDLQLINTIARDASVALVAGNRNYIEPTNATTGPFVVTQQLNVITPAGTTNPELGSRKALLPMSKEALDVLYPDSTGSGVPIYFAPITQNSFIVGPWPDQNYTIEAVGTQRPAPLSPTNTTTLLSVYLPDLFLNAALVVSAGYQLNFSAASDNPQAGVNWLSEYNRGLKSAEAEEFLKKFQGQSWQSKDTSPTVQPTRT